MHARAASFRACGAGREAAHIAGGLSFWTAAGTSLAVGCAGRSRATPWLQSPAYGDSDSANDTLIVGDRDAVDRTPAKASCGRAVSASPRSPRPELERGSAETHRRYIPPAAVPRQSLNPRGEGLIFVLRSSRLVSGASASRGAGQRHQRRPIGNPSWAPAARGGRSASEFPGTQRTRDRAEVRVRVHVAREACRRARRKGNTRYEVVEGIGG